MTDIGALIEQLKEAHHTWDMPFFSEAATALAEFRDTHVDISEVLREDAKLENKLAEAQAEIAKLREALKAIAVEGATGPSCVNTARAALGEINDRRGV